MTPPHDTRAQPLVLVVDDDRLMRTLLRDALEDGDFAVAEAAGGAEALALFARLHPDLLVLDLHMPAPDGLAVCRELRARHPDDATPILVVTADEDPESLERAYAAGATDFVTKPLRGSLLLHRVRYLLRSSRTLVELARSQRSLARAQGIARLGSWEWNPESEELRWSEQVGRMLGVDPAAPASWDLFWQAVHPADRERVRAEMREGMRQAQSFRVEHRVVRADGSLRHVELQGAVAHDGPEADGWISGTIQDVTEQAHAQAQIRYLASYDTLTGLANRRLSRELLERAVAAARADGSLVGLLFLDLDRFKRVNDTLGHSVGDRLLQRIADRLRARVRGSDVVGRLESAEPAISRLGGDEFTVLLSRIGAPEEAGEVARRILQALAEPVQVGDREITLSASIGVAIHPHDGDDVEDLIKHADAAMYAAKEQGRNGFRFYSSKIQAGAMRRLELESRLRTAIERDELELHYQPRLDLRTGQVCAVEALLRWSPPEFGSVSPSELIPLAEDTGLIAPLGAWVLRTACAQRRAWIHQGYAPLVVSVNVSPRQITGSDLLQVVGQALRDTQAEPDGLEVELTERVLLQDDETTALLLRDLRAIGVRIALDDFGSGYSSLSYLARFPLDTLKMDRCFVRDVDSNPTAAGVARAVIAIGKTLSARVVAEGVETLEQEQFLREAGCDELQGFLLAGALSAEAVTRYLTRSEPADRAAPAA